MSRLAADVNRAAGRLQTPFKVLLVTDTELIWISHDYTYTELVRDKSEWMANLRVDRGDILERFALIEVVVDELIKLKVAGNDKIRKIYLDDILEKIDLFSRLNLMKEWGVIDETQYGHLMALKQVRNGLAHEWLIEEVMFRNKPLRDNFEEFKRYLGESWMMLLSRYQEVQKIVDIDAISKYFQEER